MPEYVSPPGRKAARLFRSLVATGGDHRAATAFADAARWLEANEIKAAIGALETVSTPVGQAAWPAADFVNAYRARSLLGRFPMREVPFQIETVRITRGSAATWVGEGAGAAFSLPTFTVDGPIEKRKVVAATVMTREFATFTEAEPFIGEDLTAAAAEAIDAAFCDFTFAGDSSTPGGIAAGGIQLPSSNDLANDAQRALNAFGGRIESAVWITHPLLAAQGGIRHAGGGRACDVGALGGTLAGLPVYTTEGVASSSSGSALILLDTSAVQFAMDGEAELDVTSHASVLMDTAPTNNSATGTETQLVSLFQANAMAMKATVYVNWRLVRQNGAVVVSGADYAYADAYADSYAG